MQQWILKLVGMICIMAVILQLLPEGKFSKYVRFYMSLLYLAVAAEPFLQFFSDGTGLEHFLNQEQIREEYYSMEAAVEGMQKLKEQSVEEACKKELTRQLGVLAGEQNAKLEKAGLTLSEEGRLLHADLYLQENASGRGEEKRRETDKILQQEIAEIYGIKKEEIKIIWKAEQGRSEL